MTNSRSIGRLIYLLFFGFLVAASFSIEARALDIVFFTNADAGTVERVDADGSNRQVLVSGLSDPQALEIDRSNGLMFWADNTGGARRIVRANLDGSNVTLVTAAGSATNNIYGIALDPSRQLVYWIGTSSFYLDRVDYNGMNFFRFTPTGGIPNLRGGVTVNPTTRELSFLQDIVVWQAIDDDGNTNFAQNWVLLSGSLTGLAVDFDTTPNTVFAASNDGSIYKSDTNNAPVLAPLISSAASQISALEFNPDSQLLYFSDVAQHAIRYTDYTGQGVVTVLTNAGDPADLAILSITPSPTPTVTNTPTATNTPTLMPTVTPTLTPSVAPTSTATATPTTTHTATATATSTAIFTSSPSPTATHSPTPPASPTPTLTPQPTATRIGTFERNLPRPRIRVVGDKLQISIRDTVRGNRDYYCIIIDRSSNRRVARPKVRASSGLGRAIIPIPPKGPYQAYTLAQQGDNRGTINSGYAYFTVP